MSRAKICYFRDSSYKAFTRVCWNDGFSKQKAPWGHIKYDLIYKKGLGLRSGFGGQCTKSWTDSNVQVTVSGHFVPVREDPETLLPSSGSIQPTSTDPCYYMLCARKLQQTLDWKSGLSGKKKDVHRPRQALVEMQRSCCITQRALDSGPLDCVGDSLWEKKDGIWFRASILELGSRVGLASNPSLLCDSLCPHFLTCQIMVIIVPPPHSKCSSTIIKIKWVNTCNTARTGPSICIVKNLCMLIIIIIVVVITY